MSTTTPESWSGLSGICEVGTVSTSPTDCRMVASSLLLSVRSDASRRRRFGDVVLLAEAVMNPSVRGVLLAEGYLKRSSLKLKGHRECRLFGIAKSLAIGLDGRMTLS